MRSLEQHLLPARRRLTAAVAAVLASAVLGFVPTLASDRQDGRHWVTTWAVSPQPANVPLAINGQTLRQVVHVSLGGEALRVRVSNAYGTAPLVIGAAHLALSVGNGTIAGGSDRVVTFGGSPTITIPAGALAVSDSVALDVANLDDVAVSLYLPDAVVATTQHETALHTTYLLARRRFHGRGDDCREHHGVVLLSVRDRGPRRETGAGRRGVG